MGVSNYPQPEILTDNTKRLTRLANRKLARNIALFNPGIDDIELLVDVAAQEIPGLAQPSKIVEVFNHNPETFWALAKTDSKDGLDTKWPEGFFAVLPLTNEGAKALVSGKLNTSSPDTRYICRQWEQPAALYFWCIFAPGTLAAGLSHWANHYCTPKYEGLPVFARAGTPSGAHFFERLGFKQGASWDGNRNDNLITLMPPIRSPENIAVAEAAQHLMPAYDNYAPRYGLRPKSEGISCSVIQGLDELMQVMAIRSAVYIGEQHCPFAEEWDGNDLNATHILARKGDEPIGTIRVRSFADFAKIERLAVLPAYRKSLAAFKLERAATELTRTMGYKKLIGHAHAQVIKFWKARGWEEITGKENFRFSDHECIQIEKEIMPHADSICFETEPLTLIRPVGRWHVKGTLDYSAARPAVNLEAEKPAPIMKAA